MEGIYQNASNTQTSDQTCNVPKQSCSQLLSGGVLCNFLQLHVETSEHRSASALVTVVNVIDLILIHCYNKINVINDSKIK